jgi:hypothetical protein
MGLIAEPHILRTCPWGYALLPLLIRLLHTSNYYHFSLITHPYPSPIGVMDDNLEFGQNSARNTQNFNKLNRCSHTQQ